ncbi:MAG: hypothetical protein H6651_20720 [Ardenticatenales bacterium]|nr:hypothetical protein [Ardenticatenales bacterium]
MKRAKLWWVLFFLLLPAGSVQAAPDDPLPRVVCGGGYMAFIHAAGLASPDGLAWGPDNLVYVAEESADRVSRIESNGSVTPYGSGIVSVEGIAFGPDGTLYAVEDIENGRLVTVDSGGNVAELVGNLAAPEGVTYHPDGNLYITQSNVQFTSSPLNYRTEVTRVTPAGSTTTISLVPFTRSYSGLTVSANGHLYVANEAAEVGPDASVYELDPTNNGNSPFVSGIPAAEGVDFASGNSFPLYLVEEDRGSGDGYLHQVDAAGAATQFCAGFLTIEDVLVAPDGNIYVSEDGSGYVIRLTRQLDHQLYVPLVIH